MHSCHNKLFFLCVLIIIIGWPLNLVSQSQTLPFQHLTLGKGMDINMVNRILQDKQGFMWFGTLDGLVRYDGYHFIHYPFDPETRHPLKGKRINGLLESPSGNIWVISNQMLLSYNPRLDTFHTIQNLAGDSLIRYIPGRFDNTFLQDTSGNLWLGSNRGLFRIQGNRNSPPFDMKHYHKEKDNAFSLNSNVVLSLLYDSHHRLWIGTKKGLNLYDQDNDRMIPVNSGCKAHITCLFEMASGKIYIGTRNAGLCVYDPGTDTFSNYMYVGKNDLSIAGNTVKQIARDGKDNIWLLAGSFKTQQMTLQRFDPVKEEFHSYFPPFPPTSISGNSSAHLFVDRAGFLWVSTGEGMKRFDPYQNAFVNIEQRTAYLKDWSFSYLFYEDQNGILWLSILNKGLLKYAPSTDKFRYYPPPEFDGKNIVMNLAMGIYEDSQGYLWRRTPSGTERFVFDENDELQKVAHFPFQSLTFFEDSHDRLWIGNMNELKGFDLATNQLLPKAILPNLEKLGGIAFEDREGWFWSPSWGKGLKRYNPSTGEIIHFTNDPKNKSAINSNFTNPSIMEDEDGNVWINGKNGLKKYNLKTGHFSYYLTGIETVFSTWGKDGIMWATTAGGGLYRLDTRTGESKCYFPKNGFPTLRPIDIFTDARGDLWMSSDVGIICFNPETETSRLYDESDGLPGVRFSYGSYQRSNGEFFFPLWEGGFVRFHPDSLEDDTVPPRPAIVNFRLFNKPVEIGGKTSPLSQAIWATDHLVLKHDQNNFTLEFSAFHYAAPAQNRLLYKMEGIGQDWNDPGDQRSVNFAGLRPGGYTFQLKAANHDGVWSNPIALKITILPPWWATNWAYLLYFLLICATVYAFYTYKKREWKLQAKLEMEHREAERLKELDQVKTRLFTNITHEFRTPLTVILGMAKQARNKPQKWLAESMKMIERNGRNLLRLVNQMLELSKLEAGVLPLNMMQSDVIAFLNYLLESFHSLAKAKNIRLEFDSDPSELIMDFDPEKLREIMSNLVTNAIKFTSEGGNIRVSAKEDSSKGSPNLVISISDNGKGIPPEKVPHIFDRFYQADDKASRNAEGTGIGLALTKELVKLLEGEITVESEVGKGSTFTIVLPIRRETPLKTFIQDGAMLQNAASEVSEETIAFTGKGDFPIVLVVEDNEDVVTYLRSVLADNYIVKEARNGREGIDKAIEITPDFIISDVMMPEIDGYQLCETLKKDARTSHIPIVLLTAKADIDSRIEGLESGADAYLAKPFGQEELLVRIKKLIELRKQLQERYSHSFVPQRPASTENEQKEDIFMQKVKETLETHIGNEDFGISELCKHLGMSRSQLYRKFNALTDQSIAHYFRSIRLDKAKELLLTTDLRISEIAYETGFKDPAHFSRIFKEAFGITPRKARKQ